MRRLLGSLAAGAFAVACGWSSPAKPTPAVTPSQANNPVTGFGSMIAGSATTTSVVDLASCLRPSPSPACFRGSPIHSRSAGALSAPGEPTSLVATVSGTSVTLAWTAPQSGDPVQVYVIEAGSASGLANLANFSTGDKATVFSASGVAPGSYYVRVRAMSASGATSGPSNEALVVIGTVGCTSAPGAPGGLTLVLTTGGTVVLAWTPAPGGPISYIVEAGSAPGLANLANNDLGTPTTVLTATGVGPGTYYVRVRARNLCGASPPSNEITVSVGVAGTLTIDARANIFGAGHATLPRAPGGAGVLPPGITFAAAAGQALRFSSVTGLVSPENTGSFFNGPDGGVYRGNIGTNITSLAGISGIIHANTNLFLVGVFLDNTEPTDPAPSLLGFRSPENFATLDPQLRQTFFIGDGRTTVGGIIQQFLVPAGATRLFLGFADGDRFQGRPAFYDDNLGSLTATLSIAP